MRCLTGTDTVPSIGCMWRIEQPDQRITDIPYSLAETCVLYELARSAGLASKTLCTRLRWEPDYLRRVVSGLGDRALVRVGSSKADPRRRVLALTAKGAKEFADLMARIRNSA